MVALEAVFRGAGWNVIKVLWGGEWDEMIENLSIRVSLNVWLKWSTGSRRSSRLLRAIMFVKSFWNRSRVARDGEPFIRRTNKEDETWRSRS